MRWSYSTILEDIGQLRERATDRLHFPLDNLYFRFILQRFHRVDNIPSTFDNIVKHIAGSAFEVGLPAIFFKDSIEDTVQDLQGSRQFTIQLSMQ